MLYLKKRGFQTIQVGELAARSREVHLLKKTVCITFDDCFESVYWNAIPILEEFGFTATCFAAIDYAGATLWGVPATRTWRREGHSGDIEHRMMDWSQVRDLHRRHIEIGSHTITHPHLANLPPELIRAEILESKRTLEQQLGVRIASFAYPFGSYNEQVVKMVREAGYSVACTTKYGYVCGSSDFHALPRIPGPILLADTAQYVENLAPHSVRGRMNAALRLAERALNVRRVAQRLWSLLRDGKRTSAAVSHTSSSE